MVRTNVSLNDPPEEHPTIGLIGMGAMGAMYAKHLSKAGWTKSHHFVCLLAYHLISSTS
jgi:prephenate dehydrogenase (NADP+)